MLQEISVITDKKAKLVIKAWTCSFFYNSAKYFLFIVQLIFEGKTPFFLVDLELSPII